MSSRFIHVEVKDSICTLTIQRPKALNALNILLLKELNQELTNLKASRDIRVLILKGAGDKAFVAGADIKEMLALSPREAGNFSKLGQDTFSLLESLTVPTIALVQGYALGGGLELCLASDILLFSEKAKLGLPEVSLGLFPSFGGTQRLSRSVGLFKAKEMIFTGQFYTAEQALSMGLGNQIVKDEDLLAEAWKQAEQIKKQAPLAVAQAKKLLHMSKEASLKEGLKKERHAFAQIFKTKDSREGMQAFIDKRKPNFNNE